MKKSKRSIGSDLKKVDAHVITPEEYKEIPEWTDEMFAAADLYHGKKLIKRGRPRVENPKKSISIRLSDHVINKFKEIGRKTGEGYQTKISKVLEEWVANGAVKAALKWHAKTGTLKTKTKRASRTKSHAAQLRA